MSIKIDVSWARFLAPIAKGSYILRTLPGSFSVTGQDARISVTSKLFPAAGATFNITGQSANLYRNRKLTASAGNFTITGQPATFRGALARIDVSHVYFYHPRLPSKYIVVDQFGSFSIETYPAKITHTRRVKADGSFFTINGFPAKLRVAHRLPVEVVSYVFSYQDVGFKYGYNLKAEPTTYGIQGTTAKLKTSRRLIAEVGNFQIDFLSAPFRKARGFLFPAAGATFVITGFAAGIFKRLQLPVATGEYTLSGNAAGLRAARRLPVTGLTLSLSGSPAGLRVTRKLSVSTRVLTATFNPTNFRVIASRITASAGFFLLLDREASLRVTRRLPVSVGEFSVTALETRVFKARRNNVFPVMIGPG